MEDQEKIERWKSRLSNLTELVLPTDYPRIIPPRIVESEYTLAITEPVSLAILKLSLSTNTSPSTILLSAFTILIHKYTQEEDITIGSSSNANPLVLRIPIQKDQKFATVIETVNKTELEAINDEIPFDRLLKSIQLENNETLPLFKVRFFNTIEINNETLNTRTSSSCDMTIFISQTSTLRRLLPIEIKIVYNSVLFSELRIIDMLAQLSQILLNSQNGQQKIKTMSLVTQNSMKVLPDPTANLKWDDFKGAITDIFNKNAEKHPDRICVSETSIEN
jgi:L-aminoadipate-semialdehyde dehydrogenase